MKRKDLLLLTLLLTQTTPVWAMQMDDDEGIATPIHHVSLPEQADQDSTNQIKIKKLQEDIQNAQIDTRGRLARYDHIADKNNKVIVIGYSGSGKTTLIEGLAGNLSAQEEDGEIKLRSTKSLDGFIIGDGQGEAGTTTPGIWYDPVKSHKMLFCDCPGFEDPDDIESGKDIINAAAIRELFTTNTQARILLVIDKGILFDAQPKALQNLLNEVAGVFPNTDQLKKRVSVVFTKVKPEKNSQKISGKDPRTKLELLQKKGKLKKLTDPARELLNFLVENSQKRIAYFPKAQKEGNYEFDKEAIFKVIKASEPTLNPVVKPYLNKDSQLLCLDLGKKLNKEAKTFFKDKGAPSIITYCNDEINKDKNSLTTLKTTLPQVVKDLRSLESPMIQVKDLLGTLDKFLPGEKNSVRKTVEMLDFLKDLKKDVTYDLAAWSQILTNKKQEVIKLISGLATHHNTEMVSFLETQGAQHVLNYCETEINNHQGSVGDLRTKLKAVLKDLQDLQDPARLPTASVFSNTLEKYLNKSTHLKDTVEAFDHLKKQSISGTIECDVKGWSGALEKVTNKIKKLTDNPEVKYEPTTGVLSLKGAIVGTSDLSTELAAHPDPVRLDVFGLHTLIVDKNIVSHGTLANFIASQWKIESAKTIDLSGKDNPNKASIGSGAGNDGDPGAPGGNGGCFYGKGISFENLDKLTLKLNGGKGGEGGNGAKGATGSSAPNGSAAAMALQSSVDHVELMRDPTYPKDGEHPVKGHKITYTSGGGKGGKGGTGGLGGAGGKGGLKGIAFIDGASQSYILTPLNGADGTKGSSGPGGDGGRGGDIWRGIKITQLKGSWVRTWWDGSIFPQSHQVTEHLSKNERWEEEPHKIGDGPRGDTGDQPAASLVSSVAPVDPTLQLCLDAATGTLKSAYKDARVQEYKDFRTLQSINPDVSPFIKLFPGL